MANVYLCFLWHMHQPFYKDLISGEYKLPWTRLHALKDYYGMVKLLDDFPQVRQTFNLVPSMLVQVQDYASGGAQDPFLQAALKPAESLSEAEQEFLLRHSFYAYPPRLIARYPRYHELYEALQAHKNLRLALRIFGVQEYRDLQVLSQLAWFEEEFLRHDPEVKEVVSKGRNFSLEDQALVGRKQREIIALVVPTYQRMAAAGRIEISTTPFYHPVLPLVCDSNIAAISHPGVALPTRFRYPQDARRQLELAREFMTREFGAAPVGLWPSEGSVSDEVFEIASDLGFRWTATDSGVLSRTLGYTADINAVYRPYRWAQGSRRLDAIFRDHFLSDLVGFVYARMDPREAARDLLSRIRENCRALLTSGRDVLVPIILDGENAWEYYEQNGRPFLSELYRLISEDRQMIATTVADALTKIEPQPISRIFPGSWINANFDVWIGAEEDNQAWEQLLRARQTFEAATHVAGEQRRLAFEELLIAEGSDWCWWYGPEHESVSRPEFDQLYRSHLANVYRALDLAPPEELSRPILKIAVQEIHAPPSAPIHPVIDGEVTSYFEWMGAGSYHLDERSGSMHGRKVLIRDLAYGGDGSNLYLRVDFHPGNEDQLAGMDARLTVQSGDRRHTASIHLNDGRAVSSDPGIHCAFSKVLEVQIPVTGERLRLQFSLWQNGLPVDAIPQQGWLELECPST